MCTRIRSFISKFIWCFPALIALISVLYFINLFERMYARDLDRQFSEKQQIANLIENFDNKQTIIDTTIILDRFNDTHTYLLTEQLERVLAKYHTTGCPFIVEEHPYEVKELKEQILTKKRGIFEYSSKNCKVKAKIYWDYRWVEAADEKMLVMIGVSNYPKDPIDKELQIAVGVLILLTAFLNWILVGYGKYLYSKYTLTERKE